MDQVSTKRIGAFGSGTQESETPVPADERLQVKSVKELGFNLPIGHVEGGEFRRGFALAEYGYELEKEVARFRRMNDNIPNTRVVTKVLSLCVTQLGGKPLVPPEVIDPAEREAVAMQKIGQLFMADVYYLWVRLRMEELGSQYKSPFQCFSCGNSGEFMTDMDSMDVFCVKDPSILEQEVKLFKGLKYRGNVVKNSVTVNPVRWCHIDTQEMANVGNEPTSLKLHFIRAAITGVNGIVEPVALLDEEIGSLRKIDVEMLSDAVNNTNLGPSLTLIGKCPNPDCKAPFSWPLNWDYDHFFSTTSL